MITDMDRILRFSIKGKFAHFRKFYTNSSSLSYVIPPRTVITGLIASVLKIPRNQYYDLMGREAIGISVSIPKGKPIKKQMQSMNYLHEDYFNLIAKGTKSGKVQHSQCKLELLSGSNGNQVEYQIHLGFKNTNENSIDFASKVTGYNLGYGVYLGQRQFRGYIENLETFTEKEFEKLEASKFLDTACIQENITSLELSTEINIQKEQMPSGFKKVNNGREAVSTDLVIFEKSGKQLAGEFKNCIYLQDKYISFI